MGGLIGPPPPLTDLPVEETIPALRAALRDQRAAVLVAAPGAGKTTVVPLRLLDEPWLADRSIVMLEPRRLAARAAARRLAASLGEPLGRTVGHRTRDESTVGPSTRIEVVTEGILVRRLQGDPALEGVGLVILDEIHERNIHSDLALALLLDARSALCPDLRLLAMSATLDATRVAEALGAGGSAEVSASLAAAPVITSDGRQHPVALRWSPPRERERIEAHVARAVDEALRTEPGDVLVFLPGAAEIRRSERTLRAVVPSEVDVRPLMGSLPVAEQDLALDPSPPGRRRVVLATDIAESSLTVSGVRVVIDAGLDRVPRLDPRSGLSRLVTVPASRASADQRAGRAGRTEPGVAVRLWDEATHSTRPAFSAPEITQVDLAPLALELAVWGADESSLRFLDPPPAAALAEARGLLVSLGALDADHRPTTLGQRIAELPVHPRLARMVLDGAQRGLGREAVLLAAALEERDVLRGRPDEVPSDAAERLRVLADEGASHPRADRDAVRTARRRAEQIARRARVRAARGAPVDVTQVGPLLGLAYPDRLAMARGGGRFRLRNGTAAWLGGTDPLADETFLVVAEVDVGARPHPGSGAVGAGGGRRGDRRPGTGPVEEGRIRIAAALDEADVLALGGDEVESGTSLGWDSGRDDLRARTERRLGALILARHETAPEPGPETTEALLDRVRETRLAVLGWTDAARRLQHRTELISRVRPEDGWPDLSDEALLADLDTWLAPHLHSARGRRDLEQVRLVDLLRARLGHPWARRLDEVAPATFRLASGREREIDWSGDQPALHVRVQDLFGTTEHPSIAGGRMPLVLHLQSPAGRDLQVTSDLPGFWAGSWTEVRKEMAGRYPRHPWPVDPATASPPAPRPRRPRR